jgi:ABC-type nitrate/sulfonate/bicarbonate transport system substrate-binding protein
MAAQQALNRVRRNTLKTIGAAALLLSGALPRGATAQRKLQKMDIFIGTTPHFGNVIVGAQKGFFEKEGLPVEITNFASGSIAADAFRTGSGSILVAGDLPSIRLWQQGFVGICPQANYEELSVIVSRNTIKKPGDMKGKKVGVLMGSTSEFFAKLYLASGGMKPTDIDMINLRPAEMVTGLTRGDIDAFVIWQPFGWRAVAAVKDAHILATGRGYFHEWEAVTTRKDYAAARGEELLAFLRGMDAAGKWIPNNLDEAAKIVAAQIRLDDVKIARDMLAKIDWSLAYTAGFRKDMEIVAEFINAKINWNTMFDPKPLAKLGAAYVG